MFKIERTDYGMKMILTRMIAVEEMMSMMKEIDMMMDNITGDFCMFIDMKDAKPMATKTMDMMTKGMNRCRQNGMKRSVMIMQDTKMMMRLRKTAMKTGMHDYMKYIDATSMTDCDMIGMDWLIKAEDPEMKMSEKMMTK